MDLTKFHHMATGSQLETQQKKEKAKPGKIVEVLDFYAMEMPAQEIRRGGEMDLWWEFKTHMCNEQSHLKISLKDTSGGD